MRGCWERVQPYQPPAGRRPIAPQPSGVRAPSTVPSHRSHHIMAPTVDVAMPPSVDLPADFATRSTVTYRIWIFTASDDPRGTKGDVSVCLHGALGSVWLQQLQEMRPSGTLRLGVIDADAHGRHHMRGSRIG